MICKNCKYHYIEELSFDYPQSCCRKRSETTEQWCKCNDFEYGDRYIEQLQQENKQLKEVIDEVRKHCNQEIKSASIQYERDKRFKHQQYIVYHERVLQILDKVKEVK